MVINDLLLRDFGVVTRVANSLGLLGAGVPVGCGHQPFEHLRFRVLSQFIFVNLEGCGLGKFHSLLHVFVSLLFGHAQRLEAIQMS